MDCDWRLGDRDGHWLGIDESLEIGQLRKDV